MLWLDDGPSWGWNCSPLNNVLIKVCWMRLHFFISSWLIQHLGIPI